MIVTEYMPAASGLAPTANWPRLLIINKLASAPLNVSVPVQVDGETTMA